MELADANQLRQVLQDAHAESRRRCDPHRAILLHEVGPLPDNWTRKGRTRNARSCPRSVRGHADERVLHSVHTQTRACTALDPRLKREPGCPNFGIRIQRRSGEAPDVRGTMHVITTLMHLRRRAAALLALCLALALIAP